MRIDSAIGDTAPSTTDSLKHFDCLPDSALMSRRAISSLFLPPRSSSSIYRDVAAGRLARPRLIGGSARWTVADVRAYLKGKAI
jgi:hypothetical protein